MLVGAMSTYLDDKNQKLEKITLYSSLNEDYKTSYVLDIKTEKDAHFVNMLYSNDIKSIKWKHNYILDENDFTIEYFPASAPDFNIIIQFFVYFLQFIFKYYPYHDKNLWKQNGLVVENNEQFYLTTKDEFSFTFYELMSKRHGIYRCFENRFYIHPHIFLIYLNIYYLYAFILRKRLDIDLNIDYTTILPKSEDLGLIIKYLQDYQNGNKKELKELLEESPLIKDIELDINPKNIMLLNTIKNFI
jgi:hypothetical protein